MIVRSIAAATILLSGSALANPNGAPWGAANPNASDNCASCHFDNEPVMDSSAITVRGLSDGVTANAIYDLALTFVAPTEINAGFAITSTQGDFVSGERLEAKGSELRSTQMQTGDRVVSWSAKWRAPETFDKNIMFFVAVNASNDDQSPFGDEVHFKSVSIDVKE